VDGLVKTVVYWGKSDAAANQAVEAAGVAVYSFDDFLKLGRENPAEPVPPKPEDLCTIMCEWG
jgi:long-chain acyl-CoA synthetase